MFHRIICSSLLNVIATLYKEEKMKNLLLKAYEDLKNHKKKIVKITIILGILGIIGISILGGGIFYYAKSHINYNIDACKEIALKAVPGEVVEAKTDFDFDSAKFEYEFKIKNDKNIISEVTVDSRYGGITDLDDNFHKHKKHNHHEHENNNSTESQRLQQQQQQQQSQQQ